MTRILSLVPPHRLKTAIWALLGLAFFSTLGAVGTIATYFETTETSGLLWWRESREIPLDERRPALVAGVLLSVLTVLLLLLVMRVAWHLLRTADERRAAEAAAAERWREEERRAAEREAHLRWLETYEGDAWTAWQRGDSEHAVTLQVLPPDFRETIREIEGVGWAYRGRDDHPAVHTKDSRRNFDGGHTVTRTTTQDATFYFGRP